MPNREATDADEAKALADIEYGCLYVLEEDDEPPFASSVGIAESISA
ncbi:MULTISPECIES: hypothetical protein [unclassified Mesorhizobium]|nr:MULTISPECIES: hypothetical protein [unclassified Mesorhizobium]